MVGQSDAQWRRFLQGDSPDGHVEGIDEGIRRETGALAKHCQARYDVRVGRIFTDACTSNIADGSDAVDRHCAVREEQHVCHRIAQCRGCRGGGIAHDS